MESLILNALKEIQNSYNQEFGSVLPPIPISIHAVLEKINYTPVHEKDEFYASLERLEMKGRIVDGSSSNGKFGRTVGADGEYSVSYGTTIQLR